MVPEQNIAETRQVFQNFFNTMYRERWTSFSTFALMKGELKPHEQIAMKVLLLLQRHEIRPFDLFSHQAKFNESSHLVIGRPTTSSWIIGICGSEMRPEICHELLDILSKKIQPGNQLKRESNPCPGATLERQGLVFRKRFCKSSSFLGRAGDRDDGVQNDGGEVLLVKHRSSPTT
ncbi:hypothetical protein ANN_27155 [Periplaneta americana]|uniref:Uncharacterized protein n=1 Tax=Periplaneta americana TaxID=6978 RepID=A0ABQ8RX83_PERAM|nr:hypothetical protein ANN_27155 [Periplaneta americana]